MKSIPSKTTSAGPEEGPEEGEIVSDDFEDISDESIIFTPSNGKSLSRSDHLNALSLSSITDLEDFSVEKRRKRKKCSSQRHAKRRKRSRRKLVDSDSSDDDTTLDRRLKVQLKAAVRVDVEEAHKNSLRTRLQGMVRSPSGHESDDKGTTEQKLKGNGLNNVVGSPDKTLCIPENDISVIEIDSGTDSVVSAPEIIPATPEMVVNTTDVVLSAPENLESSSSQPRDDFDSELIQLRIEALKTAINNKFANRKRRKKDNINGPSSDDTNKENTNNNSGEAQDNNTETKVEIPQTSPQSNNEPDNDGPFSPEEDEDVLRALLLASMSKKITSIEPEPIKAIATVLSRPVVGNFTKVTLNKVTASAFKLNNVKKVVNNIKKVVNKASGNTKLVKMPQVKPLIISVNSDSDSDLDLSSSPEKSSQQPRKGFGIESNKTEENRIMKNLEAVIENSVDKFLREQRAKVESESKMSSLEKVTNVETKKSITSAKDTAVVKNQNSVGSTITKNTQYTKNITSSTNKITTNLQTSNSTPSSTKNVKLAEIEKSALKFLPENKREEYKQLQNMLKLRKAQLKKTKVRRTSHKLGEIENRRNSLTKSNLLGDKNGLKTKATVSIVNKVTPGKRTDVPRIIVPNKNFPTVPVVPKMKQNKTNLTNKTTNNETIQKMENSSQLSKMEARNQERRNLQLRVEERKSDALLLHTTLKEMQTRKDGRLQIQDRYKSLRPLIKKINDVSKEQKQWDHQVKSLLERLSEARKKQQEVHQSMSAFVKELAERKKNMDESPAKPGNKPKTNNPVTSTPFKQNISEISLDISAVDGAAPSGSLSLSATGHMSHTNTATTLVQNIKDDSKQTDTISEKSDLKNRPNNTWEQSTVDNNVAVEIAKGKRVASDTEFIVIDPIDLDQVMEEKVASLEKEASVKYRRSGKVRYVSPLDAVKRKEEYDPFAIMCPFEVNGMCKDSECTFKHLPQ